MTAVIPYLSSDQKLHAIQRIKAGGGSIPTSVFTVCREWEEWEGKAVSLHRVYQTATLPVLRLEAAQDIRINGGAG